MDEVTKYRQLLKQILSRHLELVNRRTFSGLDSELILDEERDNYMRITIGWSGEERIDGITFFARIRDGAQSFSETSSAPIRKHRGHATTHSILLQVEERQQ